MQMSKPQKQQFNADLNMECGGDCLMWLCCPCIKISSPYSAMGLSASILVIVLAFFAMYTQYFAIGVLLTFIILTMVKDEATKTLNVSFPDPDFNEIFCFACCSCMYFVKLERFIVQNKNNKAVVQNVVVGAPVYGAI